MSNAYRVTFEPVAARQFAKLPAVARRRVSASLERLSVDFAEPQRRGAKRVKSIKGVSDSFRRLRVGDYRVMFDVIDEDRVVLVAAVVHRGELERWLRSR